MSDAWIGVIGALGGASIGIAGQWFMSWRNHKRELRKIAFEEKTRVIFKLIQAMADLNHKIAKINNMEYAEPDAESYNKVITEYQAVVLSASVVLSDDLYEKAARYANERTNELHHEISKLCRDELNL
ncbi:hypothetical protein Dacet_0771 [Denitrovibrio acetiphilus DSM 12809]|uniref:Uncharacterized protein n=1 Tax=Denitrovibrio acetiphilus (strain DSM 12809 / NBRC 114555 / N2460) TaxID=522772 RepID=D4H5D2_DENA2|nr:hypothetical protein [Denitrovibrio acetiphilus]ADD67552.1 hypothetical protein Dacet_0771 [Denitrovibrio acetiphilus DSM 12809]